MLPLRSSTPASLRPRGWTAIVLAAMVVFSSVAVGGQSPAEGADGRIIEMTTAVPERGYWLRSDPMAYFEVRCLEGEWWTASSTTDFSSSGSWGSYGFGTNIAEWTTPGTYEVVVDCRLLEDMDVVMGSKTFHLEIGAHTRLAATVGTVEGECATTSEITVDPGTEVFWCYTLLPHPDLVDEPMFTWWDRVDHSIGDTLNGALGTSIHPDVAEPLGTGLSSIQLGLVSSSVVDATVTNTATWSTLLTGHDSHGDVDDQKHMLDVEASARVVVIDDSTTDTTDPDAPEATDPTAPTSPAVITAADPAIAVTAQPSYTG